MAGGYIPRFCWDLVIASGVGGNNIFQVDHGGGAVNATVAAGTYFWRGDGTAADFCLALKTALDAVGGRVYTVTISTTGVLTISAAGGASTVLSLTGVNSLVPAVFGWTAAADHVVTAPGYTGTMQAQNAWFPEQMVQHDTENHPVDDGVYTVIDNGRHRSALYGSRTRRDLYIDCLPPRKIFSAEEVRTYEAYERLHAWCKAGGRLEYTPDVNFPAVYSQYVVDGRPPWPTLTPRTLRRYDVDLPLARYVA